MFLSNSKFHEEIILNSKPRDFPEFSFQIPSQSEEVSIEKVVNLFDTFKTIFYFKNFELGKVIFLGRQSLKQFASDSNSFCI
jgi:hypothetical protein